MASGKKRLYTISMTQGREGIILRDLGTTDVRSQVLELNPGETMTIERTK